MSKSKGSGTQTGKVESCPKCKTKKWVIMHITLAICKKCKHWWDMK